MKKIFYSLVVLLSLFFLWIRADFQNGDGLGPEDGAPKREILKFALVADSENDNENLEKALESAKSLGATFVIGLGDWTQLGLSKDLLVAKQIFDNAGLEYYVTVGDRDLWDSRNRGLDAKNGFNAVFGKTSHIINREGIQIVILDNGDIYKGIDSNTWQMLNKSLDDCDGGLLNKSNVKSQRSKLCFVFAHKTPFHPQSSHIMGADSNEVAFQAREFMALMEQAKVDGFFSGDLHFFAQFQSPANIVKITTIGAVDADRNFQGSRFATVTVYSDYSWEVEDIEIR